MVGIYDCKLLSVSLDRVLPGGPVVENPLCQCRGRQFNPWSGKISRAMGQLSPCTATAEAHTSESLVLRTERSPCTITRVASARRTWRKPVCSDRHSAAQNK